MANEVRLTLPPESMQWGRSVESRLANLERVSSNLNTSVSSTNASLSAVLKANRENAQTLVQVQQQQTTLNNQQTTLSNQQTTLSNQQTTLSNQQTTLSNQQIQINNQVAFLATQTEFLTGDNIRGWTSPSDGASYTFPFDPLQDITGTFTTSSTGRILATLSSKAHIVNPAGKSGKISVYVNFQKGGTIDSEGLWVASAPSEGQWQFNFSGAARNFSLDPNSTYTATSEVTFEGDEDTWITTHPLILQITKLGM